MTFATNTEPGPHPLTVATRGGQQAEHLPSVPPVTNSAVVSRLSRPQRPSSSLTSKSIRKVFGTKDTTLQLAADNMSHRGTSKNLKPCSQWCATENCRWCDRGLGTDFFSDTVSNTTLSLRVSLLSRTSGAPS